MVDLSKGTSIKTAQDESDQISLDQARAYLNETNWHAFALLEDGTPIPDDIKQARANARDTINRLGPPTSA